MCDTACRDACEGATTSSIGWRQETHVDDSANENGPSCRLCYTGQSKISECMASVDRSTQLNFFSTDHIDLGHVWMVLEMKIHNIMANLHCILQCISPMLPDGQFLPVQVDLDADRSHSTASILPRIRNVPRSLDLQGFHLFHLSIQRPVLIDFSTVSCTLYLTSCTVDSIHAVLKGRLLSPGQSGC